MFGSGLESEEIRPYAILIVCQKDLLAIYTGSGAACFLRAALSFGAEHLHPGYRALSEDRFQKLAIQIRLLAPQPSREDLPRHSTWPGSLCAPHHCATDT